MNGFLAQILETKKREVESLYALQTHEQAFPEQSRHRLGVFAAAIHEPARFSVIAEIKRASPSKGAINHQVDVTARARAYAAGGAAAISVLTDSTYFHGSPNDLSAIRSQVDLPLLRKDFIIDAIQVRQSVHLGADAILLIAAALPPELLQSLCAYGQSLGLDVLIEVHAENELGPAIAAKPSVIGINNRNLETFQVSIQTTKRLRNQLTCSCPVISESGITTLADVSLLAKCGIDGILVGEALMRLTAADAIQATIQTFSEQGLQLGVGRVAQ